MLIDLKTIRIVPTKVYSVGWASAKNAGKDQKGCKEAGWNARKEYLGMHENGPSWLLAHSGCCPHLLAHLLVAPRYLEATFDLEELDPKVACFVKPCPSG